MLAGDISLWLKIYLTKNLGPVTFRFLVEKYKDPHQIIEQIQKNIKYTLPSDDSVDKYLLMLKQIGGRCVLINDPEYPARLKHIYDAPGILFIRGNNKLLSQEFIAIVGARNSSIYGNKISYDFARKIVNAGYSIISGMARGIDRYAHLGGIKSTVAVFGSGLDVIYPQENNDIYHDIIENDGLHISEYIPGTTPNPHHFPMRNRIIAGIAKAIVVIEASKSSGSLITAQLALEYNRQIFAVPGSPLDQRSHGSNRLIQNGAYLVQTAEDILEELSDYVVQDIPKDTHKKVDLTEIQQQVLFAIGNNAMHINDISISINRNVTLVSQVLSLLEIDGAILQVGPGIFQKNV